VQFGDSHTDRATGAQKTRTAADAAIAGSVGGLVHREVRRNSTCCNAGLAGTPDRYWMQLNTVPYQVQQDLQRRRFVYLKVRETLQQRLDF
jgi:hypothetical protein